MVETRGLDAKEIKSLMSGLEKASTPQITIDILEQLKQGVIPTEKLLRETKLGIAVNKLRSHSEKKVSELVKSMIKKWKDEVTAQKASSHLHSSTPPSAATKKLSPDPAPSSAPPAGSTAPKPKVQRPPNGAPRDVKTDGVKTDIYDDRVRNSCVTVTYNALASDSDAHSDTILDCSKQIERIVFQNEKGATPTYRTKMRSLYLNLKDSKNPNLRYRVVAGEISAERLYRMSPQEMASEELKNEIKRLEEKNLFNAQGAKEQRAVTDRFTCGKCKQKRVSYYQMQTRSADEPLTTFCTCENCGNRWKFS
ncbi:transcription factor S-II, central domain-containing protein [Lipomyces tetrasporus]|uniref:Transcription elongation factor n=1 Tax=Lipomyces tetrasporus TaxID=54092 RepID=A0AAD7QRN0_9ASCO|nr:transcription factor S-II, central domain-containing protein [Lipomyces tetrasporus]KAJ8100302.1 transcription factor S-II, central domain-containing protein [Lipomyces tetrasporus]